MISVSKIQNIDSQDTSVPSSYLLHDMYYLSSFSLASQLYMYVGSPPPSLA